MLKARLLAKYNTSIMNKFYSTSLLVLYSSFINATTLPTELVVPGGIVNLAVGSTQTAAPSVYFQDKKVLVLANEEQWIAVVGIPLKTKVGEQHIQVRNQQATQNITFSVQAKDYPAQYITLKNKRMVNPNPDDLARIRSERPAINKALNTWSQQVVSNIDFSLPVKGRLSSPFGLKRFFNNQAKNPHSGLDIAAPTGTEVNAPMAGKVINTGSYYYNGNTVFLDHGQGLISAYFHLSKIHAKTGQTIQQGEILGEIGATGRVTGPHLHWNVYLNKTKVDPALFVPTLSPSTSN